jgi:hypothetical protein
VLGYVSTIAAADGLPLRMCEVRASNVFDEFLSTDPACEGELEFAGWSTGWLWPAPPAGSASRQLFACRGENRERFESLDRFCDGAPESGRSLGYVTTRL